MGLIKEGNPSQMWAVSFHGLNKEEKASPVPAFIILFSKCGSNVTSSLESSPLHGGLCSWEL